VLDLLTKRDEIQKRATAELGRRFREYDINCVAVLIGHPESKHAAGKDDPIDRLFDQLRLRRLAEEQKETYAKQEEAAVSLQKIRAWRSAPLRAQPRRRALRPQRTAARAGAAVVMGGGESGKDGETPPVPDVFGQLLDLLLSEKAGLGMNAADTSKLDALAKEIRASDGQQHASAN